MGRYLGKRLISTIPLLLVISFVVFMFIHMIPGDPARLVAGQDATKEDVAVVREQLGLDEPLFVQYGKYMKGLFTGDLGNSIKNGKTVAETIAPRLKPTIMLTFSSMIWAAIIGIAIGIIAAVFHGRILDYVGMIIAIAGISVPSFWLGLELIQLFSVSLGWLPTSGLETWKSYILPSLTMGAGIMAVLARFSRSSMLETMREDYVRTARAKGLSESLVVMRHAFKNSLIEIVTVAGLQIGGLLSGSVMAETVFSIPGLGRLLVDSIQMRDYKVVQALLLFFATEYILINLIVDVLYGVINPRVRMSRGGEKMADKNTTSNINLAAAEELPKAQSKFKEFVKKFMKRKTAVISLAFIVFIILMAIIGPYVVPYDPQAPDYTAMMQGPSAAHIWGTNEYGQDVFSRLMVGTRLSLTCALTATIIGTAIGVVLGLIAGFYGGIIDSLIMRCCDVLFAFPDILLAIAVVAIIGQGMVNVMIAVAVFTVPSFARIIRSATISVKQAPYVEVARSLGCSNTRILFVHIFPGTIQSMIVNFTMRVGTAILAASSLSFLGFGANVTEPDWGSMLSTGRNYLNTAPHMVLFPGILIFLTVLAFNLLGDGLRDTLDPKMN